MRGDEVVAAVFASVGAGVLLAPLTVATFLGLAGLRDCWENGLGPARTFVAAFVLSSAGAAWFWAGPLLVGGPTTSWWRPGGAMEGLGLVGMSAAVGLVILGALLQVLRRVLGFLAEHAPVLIREWSCHLRRRLALGKDGTAEGLRRRRDWLRSVVTWLESERAFRRWGETAGSAQRRRRLGRKLARTELALGLVEEALEEVELVEDRELEERLEEEFEETEFMEEALEKELEEEFGPGPSEWDRPPEASP